MQTELNILGALTVWRVTHLLVDEDGPWKIIARVRGRLGASVLGELMDCFYCLSVWIALPLAWILAPVWSERLLLWPALSAAAILLERVTAKPAPTAAMYWEEKENDDGVLRQSEAAGNGSGAA